MMRSVNRKSNVALCGGRLMSAVAGSGQGSTLRHLQAKLPRLPIPPLKDTLDRYLVKLRPLLTPAELANTTAAVKDFGENAGPGLQKLLQEYDSTVPDRSYVAAFWDDMYLGGRYPCIIHSNPYLLLSEDPLIVKNQTARVTQLLTSTARFVSRLRLQTMTPDMQKDSALDTTQYSSLFGTRIPTPNRDYMHVDGNARHVVILRKSRIFSVDILTHDHLPLPASVIAAQLRGVFARDSQQQHNHHQQQQQPQFDLSAFTGGEREIWAAKRRELKAYDYRNRAAFEDIESAIAGIALEGYTPKTQTEAALLCFHGYGKDRWFDKTNMWVSFADGGVGYNFEHSPADGHTVLRYVADVWADKTASEAALATTSSSEVKEVRELTFRFPKGFDEEIKKAGEAHMKFVASNDHVLLPFSDYGGDFIKGQKFSPDAYCQMAFQLAYYRRYGKVASTYESCSTKHYLAGRTETIRSVTDASLLLCQKFDDKQTTKEEKIQLLRNACNAHVERAKLAQVGLGVDRHLYGLRHLAQMLNAQNNTPIPAIFTDKGYPTLSTSVLSTSNLGTVPSLKLFGFGAVCEEGYGFGYMINKNDIPITISSWQRNTSGMKDLLVASFTDMKNLF